MHRGFVWALAASALLSAWVLLNPESKPARGGVIASVERATSPPTGGRSAVEAPTPGQQPSAQGTRTELLQTWPTPVMETAPRSPFAAPTPPAPKPIASALVAPPPPAPPPQVIYRFWGSLVAPAGDHILYVTRDDNAQPIAIHVGTRLDGGFEVEQITAAAIVLLQSGSGQRVTLSMSPPSPVGAR